MLPSAEERQQSFSQAGQSLRLRTLKNSEQKGRGGRKRLYSSGSTASVGSVRSRVESETDYEDIHAPQPRYNYPHLLQPWLNEYQELSNSSHTVPRPSSPLRPINVRASSPSIQSRTTSFSKFPSSPTTPTSAAPPSTLTVRRSAGKSTLDGQRTESMARRWVRWMAKVGLRDWVLPLSVAASLWFRWVVGLGGYSGYNSPPMHGDFEAQRHWMEITLHLPTRQWYYYDLPYWGLDYPPLTAYVSYAWGLIAHWIEPSWVALDSSRKIETSDVKVFMRASVLCMDLLVYIPAVVWFSRLWLPSRSRRTQNIALLTILLQPALILVDNGHFQYNSVMLGLTLLTLNLFHSGHDILGAIAFVLSLCFKQMALYYSPAVFAYLLGRCIMISGTKGFIHLIKIGVTTVLSFILLFSPFLFQSFPNVFLQSLVRIFPFSRGLFEDKVANFWCATNVVIKWKNLLPLHKLPKLATLFTLAGILPPMIHLLVVSWGLKESSPTDLKEQLSAPSPLSSSEVRTSTTLPGAPTSPPAPQRPGGRPISPLLDLPTPTVSLLPYALLNCSLAFFLFSFQVHEKSILLPLLPLTLIMSGRSETDDSAGVWEWGVLVNNVAVFSMWPLLKKDGLGLQYTFLTFFWNYLIGYNPAQLPFSFIKMLSLGVYAAIAALHLAEVFISPPSRLPDLFPVLNVLVCTPVFFAVWLWGMKKQLEAGWAVGGLPGSSSGVPASHPTTPYQMQGAQLSDTSSKKAVSASPTSPSRRQTAVTGANGHPLEAKVEGSGPGSLPIRRSNPSLGDGLERTS